MSNRRVRQAKKEANDAKAAELLRIYKKYGEMKASYLVDESRDESAPYHNDFEWDNEKAGHEYRLNQARRLIRVHYVVLDPKKPRERWVHVPPTQTQVADEKEGAYHPTSVVVEDVDMFQRALGELETKLRSALQAADELRMAAEQSGSADQMQMAQIAMAMSALKTASDVVKSLH